MPEVVGDAGILLPEHGREEWIHTLQSELSDPKKLNKLKSAAAKRSAKFSWQRSAEEINFLYRMPEKEAQVISRPVQ
jgi:glycosyltransferase involved in cell wall biosynthesis